MDVNIFGLGINSDDVEPFFGSDFYMPHGFTKGEGARPGDRAKPGMPFALFGEGKILATVKFLGCSWREHRWEHRKSQDGEWHDYRPGWVLDLDPNSWTRQQIPCDANGQSYRYGYLSEDNEFTQLTD